jgi:hypothetical protein
MPKHHLLIHLPLVQSNYGVFVELVVDSKDPSIRDLFKCMILNSQKDEFDRSLNIKVFQIHWSTVSQLIGESWICSVCFIGLMPWMKGASSTAQETQ